MAKRHATHRHAADAIGMNLSTFRGNMYRRSMLSADKLYRLAQLLDTTMEYLLVGKEPCMARYVSAVDELESLAVTALEIIRNARASSS